MSFPSTGASADTKFLTSPGNLGQMILDHDWSKTPLGPIDGWPSSLRTAVSLMLSSRQPMWIGWGAEATFLYNDAYIDVLSLAKHPWALGRPAAEVWSEIWHICGPLADIVFVEGDATMADDVRLFMNRGDFLEETYYSFSYSPIRDESGNVAGLFCPNLNVTATHLNARRLRSLSEMSARALTERSVQAACLRAIDTLAGNPSDLPFVLIYLTDTDGAAKASAMSHPRLADAGDVCVGEDGAPAGFPVAQVIADGVARRVRLTDSPLLPMGLADQRLGEALVLPLLSGKGHAIGALVAGVSSAQRLDASYRSYFDLVAAHVTSAIQNAQTAEDERIRLERMAELDQAKTQFFSNVSHEFRTPLTLMLGPIEEALDDTVVPLAPGQRERVLLMQRNALRLQKLVNTLLEFSRVQAGRAHADFVPSDLSVVTAELAGSFRSTVEAAGVELVVDCPPLAELVYIDPSMWEKIILNLLSNAFKFTFEGHIAVTTRIEGDSAIVSVSDTGSGIAADELPRLFERFHRIAGGRSRTHEGSGIGLALVHDLVALHGGRIEVASQLGQGTTFQVVIPLGHAHLDPAQVRHDDAVAVPTPLATRSYVSEAEGWIGHAPEAAQHGATGAVAGERILVADDNADMRDYLHRLFSQRWQVEVVADGEQALLAAARQRPDVIVSDVMMPRLDGFGLIERLRSDEATRHIPVILLSARAGEEARVEGLGAGAEDYIVKPFSGRELLARVDSLLMRRRVREVEVAAARRMHAIFAQAPVAIAITRGPNHVYEQANQYYFDLVGHRPLVGLPIRAALPELDGQGIFELLDTVFCTRQPHVGRSRRVQLARDGANSLAEYYFDFVYQPLIGDDGHAEGVAIVVFEVTELANSKRAAESANRAKDEFLAMLGHELRNPLAPIITALQLMRMRGIGGAEKERLIIERQANHLVKLVDDLLDVSRVAQGKIMLHKQRVEIARVIAQAIETVSPSIEQKYHRLLVDVPADGLAVLADPARLAQAVANVLLNASKYTEPRGELRIEARREDGDVLVTVVDNGIGIAADMLPLIFDLFVQERQALSRSQGGLGLGLAIVKSMMELHEGSVSAASAGTGSGSTFVLRLPALDDADKEAPVAPAADTDAPASAKPLSILIVDDNVDAARVLCQVLEMRGHRVAVAFDGPAALVQAARQLPDVALLDIGLPGMDGYELAQMMRELPGGESIRLCALTGYGSESDRLRSSEVGFDQHLVKPIVMEEVEAFLHP
jgi:signal transduction histidine kinase